MAWKRSSALALCLAVGSGCAGRNEARVRSAWNDRSGGAQPSTAPGDTTGNGPDGDPTQPAVSTKQGWARVDELLTRSVDVLTTSPDPGVLAELARIWCEVEPIPRQTSHGSVRVCYLNPPVRVDGVALTLELGELGVIGFVAPDLSESQSAQLARSARDAVGHMCRARWAKTAQHEFHACPLRGGSTLAVGRIFEGNGEGSWQVSIAILGAV